MFRTLALVIAVVSVSIPAFAQTPPRERKNIDELDAKEVAAYRHAIDVLQKSQDADNNYAYHAALHNRFTINPPHGCEHGNDLFFPWHRYHLANFEKALQNSDPNHPTLSTKNVTVPYWNWTRPPSGERYPKYLEEKVDPDGKPNPLFHKFRTTKASQPLFTEAYMTEIVRGNADWNAFAGGKKRENSYYGAFEQPSHNDMHGAYIGGTMGDPSSAAEDPIYWSFHAFIDLTWDRWQKIHGKELTSSLDEVLQGFTGTPKVRGTVDVDALGYYYKHTPESISPMPPRPAPFLASRSLELATSIAGAEHSVAMWGGEGPFSFKVAKPGQFQRADLWFDDVRIPVAVSFHADVFIHPVGQKPKPSHSAGFISVWRGHTTADGRRHHTTGNLFLTVTEPLRRIVAANPGKQLMTTLVVTRIVDLPTDSAHPTAPTVDEQFQFRAVRLILDGGGPFVTPSKGTHHDH